MSRDYQERLLSMGRLKLTSFLILWFWVLILVSYTEQLNTDADYLASFLQATSETTGVYNFAAPVCSWEGVVCDKEEKYIVKLRIAGAGLKGPIPDNSLGKLTKLEYLDLGYNELSELPSDIWGLSTLRYLSLSNNNLTEPLPNNIGNFGALKWLDLSSNSLSGYVPESLGSVRGLRFLNLSNNLFNGSIPQEVFCYRFLVGMDLSSNQLAGHVPFCPSSSLGELRTLNLADNQLVGQLDAIEFSQVLPAIAFFNISNNQFTGQLYSLSNMSSLEVLDVSNNAFDGSLNSDMWASCHRIAVLRVGMNKLSGKMPRVYGSSLRELDVSNNMFGGLIPPMLINLSSLRSLDLSDNRLSGKLPENFSSLRSLQYLNLAGNRFSLTPFPNTSFLDELEYLNLSASHLTGGIPAEVFKLSRLKVMDVSENLLVGRIPLLPLALSYLDVSVNKLTGDIPMALGMHLDSMAYFNFSYNNLTLCMSRGLTARFPSAFQGISQSNSSCPIAVNPHYLPVQRHVKSHLGLALGIGLGCLLVGLVALAFTCRNKSKWVVKQMSFKNKEENHMSGPFSFETDSFTWSADVKVATSVPVVMFEKPLLNITFADLLSATCNFNKETLLAEGRYGPVYRAVLAGALNVAVKVLIHERVLNDQEAATEFEFLGRIKHPNLVPLFGYCIAGDRRIAIYDFMENGTLHHWLHDLPLGIQATEDWSRDTWERNEEEIPMDWMTRHKIALGIARALAFLHHGCSPPIVHRDVKASSIYLDATLEPHLADFGLANITCGSENIPLAGGAHGYAPPEYGHTWTATSKGDVYSYGVVLFELITGRRPVSPHYYPDSREVTLVGWVRYLVKTNRVVCAIDPKLASTGPLLKMQETLRIGYLCTADCPSKRPTMQQIVGLLKDMDPTLD